jgi:rhodanese-related sulfurtransferase
MKKSVIPVVAFLIVAVSLSAPITGSAADYPASVVDLVAAAKKAVNTVGMAEFKSHYDKKDLGLLIDVRDPNEFATGHIPGAINISRGTIEMAIWKHVGGADKPDMNTKMTLYCRSGSRCALAAKSLKDLGFTRVTAVDMKFSDWQAAGYPVVVPE